MDAPLDFGVECVGAGRPVRFEMGRFRQSALGPVFAETRLGSIAELDVACHGM